VHLFDAIGAASTYGLFLPRINVTEMRRMMQAMSVNIEIKAMVRDLRRQQEIAAALSTAPIETFQQTDTFFRVPAGYLKLREFQTGSGELIQYVRDDLRGPKASTYVIVPAPEPALLKEALVAAIGVVGEVRKRRTVYHIGQTRIHFDQVEELGDFIELEVVLQPGQNREVGEHVARTFMRHLEISDADLVDGAYIDLLNSPSSRRTLSN
jgi:adenylate cyclase class IV